MDETTALSFGTLDMLIVGTMVLTACLGLLTGFIWQLAGIASMLAGVIATIFFGDMASQALERWITNPAIASLIAHIGVFSVASITVRVLAALSKSMLEKMKLKSFDRGLGGILGAVKGLTICAVLVVILDQAGTPNTQEMVRESLLAAPVLGMVDLVVQKADDADITDKGKQMLQNLKDAADTLKHRDEPPGETPATGDPLPAEAGEREE